MISQVSVLTVHHHVYRLWKTITGQQSVGFQANDVTAETDYD